MIYVWADGSVADSPFEHNSDDFFTISGDATVVEIETVLHSHFGDGAQYTSTLATVLECLCL